MILINPTDQNGPFSNSVVLGYSFLTGFYAAFDLDAGKIGFSPQVSSLSYVTVNQNGLPDEKPQVMPDDSFPVWVIILIVISLIVILFGVFYYVKIAKNKRLAKQLKESNDEDSIGTPSPQKSLVETLDYH